MIKNTSMSTESALVANVMAKLKHDIYVKLPYGRTKFLKVGNNSEGIDKCSTYLSSLNCKCRVALEPTVEYHQMIAVVSPS